MTSQTTQIPSPFSALLNALSDSPDSQMSKSIMAIGGALAAAGVGLSRTGDDRAALGALVVDASLPKAIAAAQSQDQNTGRVRSTNA